MFKKNRFNFAILSTLLTLNTAAYAELKSAKALSVKHSTQEFTATLEPGYHFNDQAPNLVTVNQKEYKPILLEKNRIKFQWNLKKWGTGLATIFVCDDAKTFCETHEISLAHQTQTPTLATQNHTDPLSDIFKQAKKNKKFVLLDFSARWCPGCVRYEKETFSTNQFKEITKNFIFYKIDVDLFKNFDLSKKYQVDGIPSLIAINSDGEVIDRIVDFQPMDILSSFIKNVESNPTPLNKLLENQKNTQNQLTLAKRLLAAQRFNEAVEILKKINPEPAELIQAQVLSAKNEYDKNPEHKKPYIEQLKKALSQENKSSRSLNWRAELAKLLEQNSEEVKTLVQDGQKLADELLSNENQLKEALKTDDIGEFSGFEKMLIAFYLSDLLEASGAPSSVAWQKALELGKFYKISAQQAGPARRYLLVLVGAEKYAEAESLVNEILKNDPNNFDVQRRKIKILMALNKYAEAVSLGKKIIKQAEGRNQFWVAESLAKSYLALNKKADAKKIINLYLSREEINLEKMQSSRKNLQDLLKQSNESDSKQ